MIKGPKVWFIFFIIAVGCQQLWTTRFGPQSRHPPPLQVPTWRCGCEEAATGYRRRWTLSAHYRCYLLDSYISRGHLRVHHFLNRLGTRLNASYCTKSPNTRLDPLLQCLARLINISWGCYSLQKTSQLSVKKSAQNNFTLRICICICRWRWWACFWLEQEWSAWSPSMWRCHCSSSTNNHQATTLPHNQSHESVVWLEPYSGYWRWRVPHCMGLQCIWTVGSSRCCKANRETCCLATAGGRRSSCTWAVWVILDVNLGQAHIYLLNATGHVGLSHRTHSGVFWFQACWCQCWTATLNSSYRYDLIT